MPLMKLNRLPRSFLAFLHDFLAVNAAWLFAFALRFNFKIPPDQLAIFWQTLPWVVVVQSVVFWRVGLYRGVWRFASIHDLKRILIAVGLSSLIAFVVLLMLRLGSAVSR